MWKPLGINFHQKLFQNSNKGGEPILSPCSISIAHKSIRNHLFFFLMLTGNLVIKQWVNHVFICFTYCPFVWILHSQKLNDYINTSCPDSRQGEKINLKYFFTHFFVVPQKVLWRPLRPWSGRPQWSVKIKI